VRRKKNAKKENDKKNEKKRCFWGYTLLLVGALSLAEVWL
jgi:hypothetical protein